MTAARGVRAAQITNITAVAGRPAGVAGPYVGRARELAAVAKLIADDERTGVVLVGGEAGLGKTRMIDEIVGAHPGADVVRGGAVPRTTPSPFELIRTAVEPAARAWTSTPEQLEPLLEAAHAVLYDHADPDARTVPVAEQIRAAAEILRALHSERTIFVFDDIHWADSESLEVVDRLMAAGPLQATVLVTYRPEALRPGHPVNTFLQRAERRAHALQLRLEPLRRDEVAEYLAATQRDVGERTVDRVHARTGGNPLFLSELVGAADDDSDLIDSLPWTLAEILRPEIERLPETVRAVAQAVAVLGADAEFDLVAAAVSVEEDELLGRLRHLVEAGILVESGPDRFDFRHELVREAVAEELFTREQRRIHAAAHDALLASGSDDEIALITHAAGAGRVEEAADAARAAALRALDGGSSHQAVALAEQALLVYTDDVALLRTVVSAGWMTERYRVALDHLSRWDELAGSDPEPRAEVLHWRVRLLWEMGDSVAAEAAARELTEVTDQLDAGTPRAQGLADLAQHRMLSGQFADAVVMADRAIELAEEVDSPAPARQARAERGSALLFSPGERERGIAELSLIADDAEASGDWVVASRALNNIPILTSENPRRHLERMRAASQRAGLTCIATYGYRFALLDLAEAEGDRSEYEALLETTLADIDANALALAFAATLAASDGRFDEARWFADRLVAAGTSDQVPPSHGAGVRALIELQANGETDGLTTWLSADPLTYTKGRLILKHLTLLIDAGLSPDVLAALVEGDDACCSDRAIEAVVAELGNDLDTADEIYREIIESTEGRSVVTLAQVHLGRARVARARGADDREHLDAAAARLSRWPGRLRDRIESLSGAPCPDLPDPRRLTPREQEVALLVTQGLTNGGIAEELFISTKTASVHVSNILSKLNMSSRTEIAAWVASGNLHDD